MRKEAAIVIDTVRTRKCFKKYEERGFKIIEAEEDQTEPDAKRTIDDEKVMVLKFKDGDRNAKEEYGEFHWKLRNSFYTSHKE
ncbi:hypothetical protein D9613_000176 [Agrocybe pediades]|uniref:Uncharacterized protein n=1 Tax=Agrocybe pediades TaxID=84607 RepID=A0A8H4R1B6_9AGAR|nr:hypothetical protein D9613_000176 [Agrocybe pediades]